MSKLMARKMSVLQPSVLCVSVFAHPMYAALIAELAALPDTEITSST